MNTKTTRPAKPTKLTRVVKPTARLHTLLVKYEYGNKQYAFNTNAAVKEGDRFKLDAYDTPITVVAVLPKAFSYINTSSGKLLHKRDNATSTYPIREFIVREEQSATVITATRLPAE